MPQPRPPTTKSTKPAIPKPRTRSSRSMRAAVAPRRRPAPHAVRLQVALALGDRWARTNLARELLHAECDVSGLDDLVGAPHAVVADLGDDDQIARLVELAALHPTTVLVAVSSDTQADAMLHAAGLRRVQLVSGTLRPRELADVVVRLASAPQT